MIDYLTNQALSCAGDQIHTIRNWVHAYRYAAIAKNVIAERTSKRCLEWFIHRRKSSVPITRDDCMFVSDVFLTQEKEAELGMLR